IGSGAPRQNFSVKDICHKRGKSCPVMVPKAELVAVVFGAKRLGWFHALIPSARYCSWTFSLIGNFLISEKSQRACPLPRIPLKRSGETRMLLARACAELRLNPAFTLNH